MQPFNKNYEVKASQADVFDAISNAKTIEKWSGAPATMDGKAGSEYSIFGGQITGVIEESVPNEKLVITWVQDTKVTITLTTNGDTTTANVLHEGLTEENRPMFSQGWDDYYFGPLQKMFTS